MTKKQTELEAEIKKLEKTNSALKEKTESESVGTAYYSALTQKSSEDKKDNIKKTCPKCGAEVKEGYLFCESCGAKL